MSKNQTITNNNYKLNGIIFNQQFYYFNKVLDKKFQKFQFDQNFFSIIKTINVEKQDLNLAQEVSSTTIKT